MAERSESKGLPEEAYEHYAELRYEARRLESGAGRLELARTRQVLEEHLPPPPALVVDAAGGAGVYACWLARAGYEVHLIDAVDLHVEQAREASRGQPEAPLASAEVGDARCLPQADASADAVLLMGPLYHLVERQDRLAALAEAGRVVRPGGLVVAAAISRFASAMDGLFGGYLDDPEFRAIVDRDLESGQHRNPSNHPSYFTTAYFHHPRELEEEATAAGLVHEATLAVEGPGWLLQDLDDHWSDPERRSRLLALMSRLEREPSMLGASAHLLALARRAA